MKYVVIGAIGVILVCVGFIMGEKHGRHYATVAISEMNKKAMETLREKYNYMYSVCYLMIEIVQKNIDISTFFERNGFNRVAIYGMNRLGLTMKERIQSDKVTVVCGIDPNFEKITSDIPIISPGEKLPEVKCVVVVTNTVHNVRDQINASNDCKIFEIKEILELLKQEYEL